MHTTSTPNAARLADASGGSGMGGALRGDEGAVTPARYALGRMARNMGRSRLEPHASHQGHETAQRGAAEH
jgi:hypothetical protein